MDLKVADDNSMLLCVGYSAPAHIDLNWVVIALFCLLGLLFAGEV